MIKIALNILKYFLCIIKKVVKLLKELIFLNYLLINAFENNINVLQNQKIEKEVEKIVKILRYIFFLLTTITKIIYILKKKHISE